MSFEHFPPLPAEIWAVPFVAGDVPFFRHFSVDVHETETGISIRSLPSSEGYEAAMTVTAGSNRADVWFGIGGIGGYHFAGEGGLDLLSMSPGQFVVGHDEWGGALTVHAANDTDEGGKIFLKGAAAHSDWYVDNFAGDFRLHDGITTHLRVYQADGTLALVGGRIRMGETTTPTPVDSWAHIYFKADNKLYAQSGDGVEHTVAYV